MSTYTGYERPDLGVWELQQQRQQTGTSGTSTTRRKTYADYQRELQDAIDQWNSQKDTWKSQFQQRYQPQLDWMKNYSFGSNNQWQGPQYQSIEPYTNNYQGSIDSLLARLQGGTTTSDTAAARSQMLEALGMTPEQYAQISGSAYQTAEQMQSRADQMATTESDAYKQYSSMVQSQQRSAVAAMGKQLEAIMGSKGGFQSFASAYDMTSQISDQTLKYQAQFLMDRSAQALQLIQAENTRNAAIMQSSADLQRQFLNDNWSKLQAAYQDTITAANQAFQEWQGRADVNAQDYQANLAAFMAPIQAMTDQIKTQLGLDQATFDYMQGLWDEKIQPLLAALEAAA